MTRTIALDTETTGIEPMDGHRVVEIGCVEMENGLSTGNTFHVYINPERPMPKEAFRVHGLSDEFLSDKPLFAEVAEAFLEFIGGSTLVIHNAAFDMKFLNHELGLLGKPRIENDVYDTLMVARRKYPGKNNTLDSLCKRFKIDNSGRELHGALIDADLLAQVYLELIGGRQNNISFASKKSSGAVSASATANARRSRPACPPFEIPAEEAGAHSAFVEKFILASMVKDAEKKFGASNPDDLISKGDAEAAKVAKAIAKIRSFIDGIAA